MKNIVVVDIDGTIAKMGDRLKYLQQDQKDYDSFYKDEFDDEPITEIIELVKRLYVSGYRIVFCTGRKECSRAKTTRWLRKHIGGPIVDYLCLHMRADHDHRPDVKTKPELLEKAGLTPDNVAFMLEDRAAVTKKYRELGFTVLQVAEGDY